MEFFRLDAAAPADSAALAELFADHTVLVVRVLYIFSELPVSGGYVVLTLVSSQPAVSFANLGQLTLDLIINSLLQRPDDFVRSVCLCNRRVVQLLITSAAVAGRDRPRRPLAVCECAAAGGWPCVRDSRRAQVESQLTG